MDKVSMGDKYCNGILNDTGVICVFEPKRPILKTDNKIYFIQISDVLIPVPDPNPNSDFDDI